MRHAALIAGAILALVIAAAAILPPLIDWSAYRGPIAMRVQAVTGRAVSIDGPIALRLLPAPTLSAGAVSIGNPPGLNGDMARVERLRLKLALWPLLGGKVRLEALELDQPEVTLDRTADGIANWRFASTRATAAPEQDSAPTPAPNRDAPNRNAPNRNATDRDATRADGDDALPVERLSIRDGVVHLNGNATVRGIDADIVLGGRSGPFRVSGMVRGNDLSVAVDGTVERLQPGRPAPVALALRLPDHEADLAFSGTWSDESVRGRLTAAAADPGRALARLGLTPPLPPGPLALTADLGGSAREATASEIDLTVGKARLTGTLAAAFDTVPQVDLRLHAAALDLDSWQRAAPAGTVAPRTATTPAASTSSLPPSAASTPTLPPSAASTPTLPPSAASAITAASAAGGFTLPRDVFVSADIGVDALSWRGQVVRQARLEAVLDGGEILLRQAGAQLPGGGVIALDGALSGGNGIPAFDGALRLGADNAAALWQWLGLPATGNPPRRLEVSTPLSVVWPEIRAADIRLKADTLAVRASAAVRVDDQPALAVNAVLPGLSLSARGRMAAGDRIEDGAFALNAPQGLRPLRGLGLNLPPALDRLGAVSAEGTATGSLAALAVDARAESGGVRLSARGTLEALDGAPRVAVTISARAASLGQVARLWGGTMSGGGAFALDARLAGDGRAVDLSDIALHVGPSSLGGTARLDLSGSRPSLVADLTAESLVLDGLGGGERSGALMPGNRMLPPSLSTWSAPVLPAALGGAGTSPFSREPLDLSALAALDARLSLRARTAAAHGWRLEDATLKASVHDGAAVVDTLSGRLLGGELSASARLDGTTTPTLSGRIRIAGADLGGARLSAAGLTVTSGRLDAEARFATSGRSSQDMAAALSGDGSLSVRDGVLDGFDLPAVNHQMGNLRNLGNLMGVAQAGLAGGRTPFRTLAGTFRADNGVLTTRDLRLEAEGGGASADGSVNLPEWSTRTLIAFHLAAAPQVPVAIRLEGPMENPRKVVDLNAIQHFMVSQGLGKALRQEQPAPDDPPREKSNGKAIFKNLLKGLGAR